MRKLLFCILTFAVTSSNADESTRPAKDTSPVDTSAKVAPPIEMTTYYMVFLRRGPNWTAEKTPEVEQIGKGHMNHIVTHADSGYIALAGPFIQKEAKPDVLAGICIYRVESEERARELANRDPAVKAGRFTVEILPWFGPKNLSY